MRLTDRASLCYHRADECDLVRKKWHMARPKKSNQPSVRDRMIEAFWQLLEDNQLHEISVGMIVAKAGCNRGTFYYHFADKDELMLAALSREVKGLPNCIISVIAGDNPEAVLESMIEGHIPRLSLFMEQGGQTIVERNLKSYVVKIWSTFLLPEGGELGLKSRLIIEYTASGILGAIAYFSGEKREKIDTIPVDFLMDAASVALDHVCAIQQVNKEELITRLKMYRQFSRFNLATR